MKAAHGDILSKSYWHNEMLQIFVMMHNWQFVMFNVAGIIQKLIIAKHLREIEREQKTKRQCHVHLVVDAETQLCKALDTASSRMGAPSIWHHSKFHRISQIALLHIDTLIGPHSAHFILCTVSEQFYFSVVIYVCLKAIRCAHNLSMIKHHTSRILHIHTFLNYYILWKLLQFWVNAHCLLRSLCYALCCEQYRITKLPLTYSECGNSSSFWSSTLR